MDIAKTLYKEYIEDPQYVFYKEHNTIIIMKKQSDDMECVSETEPKKYHNGYLKVVLMFLTTDPYKLVAVVGTKNEYKINETVSSYCFSNIEDAYNLHQYYYKNGHKRNEGFIVYEKANGFWQGWTDEGKLYNKGYYKDGNEHGLVTTWGLVGEKLESYFIEGRHDGTTRHFYNTGELRIEGYYEKSKAVGKWTFYKKTGEVEKTETY